MSQEDWMPTLLAAAGVPDVKEKLASKSGYKANGKKFRVHLDGYNFLPYLTGEVEKAPRREFIYLEDSGMPVGIRVDDWKLVFAENRAQTMALWAEPFVTLRMFKIFNLRRDPFERADHNSNTYWDWMIDKAPQGYKGTAVMAQFLSTFKEYPPSQSPGSFNLEGIQKKIEATMGGR